jgi:sensor histidine kinase YesM
VVGLYRLSKTCYYDFLSYYITLFRITSQFFRITSSFWYYFHTFSVLLHPFGIIFTLFRITSSFWYYFHTFCRITSPFWYYFHTFSRITPSFAITSYVTNSVRLLHRAIVDSCKPRITLGLIQTVIKLTYNQLG